MLEFFEKLRLRYKFIETNFDNSPYQFFTEKRQNINLYIESFLKKINEHENLQNNNPTSESKTVIFTYENNEYYIFKTPINFKFFYENNIIFKAYNKNQLKSILIELSNYYYFNINGGFEYDIENIISNKNINEIILYPFFTNLFCKLNYMIDLNKNIDKIIIEKELLEPLQLYIEKEEITENFENNKNFNIVALLKPELLFIFNQERKTLINKLDEYATKPHIIEPMKIVGNDGVGKSVTLQFYSSMKLEGFNKFYFNLKLFVKFGFKNYFFFELIRGFLSKEKDKINNDFNNYMNCVNYMQNLNGLNIQNFFEVLKELINYLRPNEKKYIIILDQFKHEYITDNDFEIFKSQIDKEKFRLIICCSLKDGEIKNKMFKEYENNFSWMNNYSNDDVEEDISKEENNELNEIKILSDINEVNKINLKNIFILKKRRRTENKFIEENILNKKKKENKDNEKSVDNNHIKDDLTVNEISLNNNNIENNNNIQNNNNIPNNNNIENNNNIPNNNNIQKIIYKIIIIYQIIII